ncbi:MAG TPA: hypothetical protein VF942_04705, partial [Acidimicrobiales bacterium]
MGAALCPAAGAHGTGLKKSAGPTGSRGGPAGENGAVDGSAAGDVTVVSGTLDRDGRGYPLNPTVVGVGVVGT